MRKIVPDTSAIINGFLSEKIDSGELRGCEIIIPNAVMAELELQANEGRESGFIGLEEIKKVVDLSRSGVVSVSFKGKRPAIDEIKNARYGIVDNIIREIAIEENATLLTSDRVQALVGEAYGLEVKLMIKHEDSTIPFEEFFDERSISIHLKEGVPPMAKRGKPGSFKLVRISDRSLTAEDIKEIAKKTVEIARRRRDGYIEIERKGATVVQIGEYRVAICYPPFSDGWEITVVRPIFKAKLEDFHISEKLINRLRSKAEGVIISGPPGAGKSTFAQALAEFYMSMGKIVKTMESPRDLQVPNEITQYSPLEGNMEKTADILLLVRPDYTIYDEVRKTKDFEVFTDMRLAGVGMVGVVHASKPIEAVQRFVNRIEIGVLPHVVDTVIFIDEGEVKKVYSLELKVKVPSGLRDEDLTRPVVEIRDFETENLEYEVYTFGEETIIVPVEKKEKTTLEKYAEEKIREKVEKILPYRVDVELKDGRIYLRAEKSLIPAIIGRGGHNIQRLEEELGVPVRVEELHTPLAYVKRGSVIVRVGRELSGKKTVLYADGKVIGTFKVNRNGEIKIRKNTPEAREILKAREIRCG